MQRGNVKESSRVRWRMPHVYEEIGNIKDAQLFRDGALDTKEALLARGEYSIMKDEDASWDALVGLLYR